MKRLTALLLPLALLLSIGAGAVNTGAEGTLFPKSRLYEGQFSDVPSGSWFYTYVVFGYEYGLFAGRDAGFAPDEQITVAELVTLSARLRAAYEGEQIPSAVPGEPWYQPYADFLMDRGALDGSLLPHLSEVATRAQMAAVFALSLPDQCYDNRNGDAVNQGYASGAYITDVGEYTPYQSEILWLYRQGLLTGMDGTGSFQPDSSTTRAQTAAVVMRIVEPSLRETLAWGEPRTYRSAVGRTMGSLIREPDADSLPISPEPSDLKSIDALARKMLAQEENTITLYYIQPMTNEELETLVVGLAKAFNPIVKSYCEQMYNSVRCSYDEGTTVLTFSATACTDEQLAQLRKETMDKAIEIHDMLWESGRLTPYMTQLEIAKVYYVWLCENCSYDYRAVDNETSLSHIAYSALLRNKAVCDGYTGAYNLLLKLEGIDCTALPNDTHIWTVAVLDGKEYHIDTTWGSQSGRVDLSYFAMTSEQSYAVHPW